MNEQPRTVYWLVSADPEKRTGVLKVRSELPANSKWKEINVSLSGLLASRIKTKRLEGLERPQTYIGTKFVSELTSPEFKANPFQLTKFVPGPNSDIPENYQLGLVIERYTPKTDLKDIMGNQISVIRSFRRTHARMFLRYIEKISTKMMSDLPEHIIVVTP